MGFGGNEMVKTTLKKSLVCGIIILFLGMSIMPIASSLSLEKRISASTQMNKGGSRDDTTPPVTVAVFDPPSECGWWQPGVTLTLNATDDESGVNVTYVQVDEEAWVVYTHCLSFGYEGCFVVRFYSVDNAGNVEDVKQVDVRIDATPPIVTCSLDPPSPDGNNGWYVSNIAVTVNATDPLSGVKLLWWRYSDSQEWQNYTGPFNLTEHHSSFETYSEDNAGNTEWGHQSIPFKIDQTPPQITLNHEHLLNKIRYTACVTDQLSGVDYVEFYFNNVLQFTDTCAPYQWTLFPIPHNCSFVTAVVYDMAGNDAYAEQEVIINSQSQQSNQQSNPSPQNQQQISQPSNQLLQNLVMRYQTIS